MLTGLLAGLALAQVPVPEVNAQLFRPSVDARAALWVDDARADGAWSARVVLGWAHEPLVARAEDGARAAIVADAGSLDLMGGATLGRVRLGAQLPLVAARGGSEGGVGLGDARVEAKLGLLAPGEGEAGLAVIAALQAPTATVGLPLGERGFAAEVVAVAEGALGPVVLLANAGARLAPDAALGQGVYGDRLIARLAAAAPLGPGGAAVELIAQPCLDRPLTDRAGAPVEALASGWARLGGPLVLRAGLGAGLTAGIGAPRVRALLALGWER